MKVSFLDKIYQFEHAHTYSLANTIFITDMGSVLRKGFVGFCVDETAVFVGCFHYLPIHSHFYRILHFVYRIRIRQWGYCKTEGELLKLGMANPVVVTYSAVLSLANRCNNLLRWQWMYIPRLGSLWAKVWV